MTPAPDTSWRPTKAAAAVAKARVLHVGGGLYKAFLQGGSTSKPLPWERCYLFALYNTTIYRDYWEKNGRE